MATEESTRVLAVAGSEHRRVVLGGDDGCWHKMVDDLGIGAYADREPLSVAEQLDQF
jgi:hypothetical protein